MKSLRRMLLLTAVLMVPADSQTTAPRKVYMVTDAEGVDGVFNWKEQCRPFESPRWAETVKLLTGEVNAAVDGLMAGGATEVVVADLHNSSRTLSTLDLDPRAKLMQGSTLPPTLGMDSSYSALIFVGQHAMGGAPGGVLTDSGGAFIVDYISFNGKNVGEIGTRAMLAGYYGVPTIMLAGDVAACRELRDLVPGAECAEVKSGLSDDTKGTSSGISLSHAAACALIREKAQRAMARLSEFKPYRVAGPYELKVVFKKGYQAPPATKPGSQRIDDRTIIYRGNDLIETWLKWGYL
jgi:D-amino peptidase